MMSNDLGRDPAPAAKAMAAKDAAEISHVTSAELSFGFVPR